MDVATLNNILAFSYLFVWVATLIWYHHRVRVLDGGSAIITMYIVYAVFSILSLNDPIFSNSFNPLKVFPYIYLYIMMMIALKPAITFHNNMPDRIENPNTRTLRYLSVVIVVCAVCLVPEIVQNFATGFVKLFTDVSAGQDAYVEQLETAKDSGSAITNIPAIIYNACSDITVFLFFYFLTLKEKSKILIIALFFSTFVGLIMPVMRGERSGVILSLLTIIGGYMTFRHFLARKINRIVQAAGVVFLAIVMLPVAAITMSRFDNAAAGGVVGFLNWYIGQGSLYFNNYGLYPGGTRHGERTMNLFLRTLDSSVPKNYTERRDKYHNLDIDDNVFSTFVGDFTIDFGPYVAVVIFVVFFFLVARAVRPRDGTVKSYQLLLLFFTICVSMQGGMYLFSFSDTANLRIIMFALLYAYLRYHEVLLKKFPLEKKVDDSSKQVLGTK